MFSFVKVLVLLCLTTLIASADVKWYEVASFYQIYPRSFKDSDGDGIGDLKGVTEELEYLKEIGITATWLSPIFTSPMADFGYDIANFTEIDPMFGTMADFDAMMVKAKSVGVKIILDLVPNHSSDECDWFVRSVNSDPEYKDFYVWHEGKMVNGVRMPPNNWISVFRGAAWTWNEVRQAYYLHQFVAKQPDLNYRNPKVVEEMKEVMRFWLRKGVDGFRVDATPHIFEYESPTGDQWPDEPRNELVTDPESYDYLQHIYTTNQPETIDLIYQFRAVMDEHKAQYGGDDRIMMTEAYAPIDVIMQYYGNATTLGSHIPFNFELISNLNADSDAHHYAEAINRWMSHMPEGKSANWVMGNHDKNRIGSRMGEDRIDLINFLLLTLPGCSITYNGEEIGMTDVWMSWEDTVDPQACQSNPEEYERLSRDPARSPFQWNNETNAGFTSGPSTWLPVSDNYKLVNVKRERDIWMSHLNVYKQLQKLRLHEIFQHGDAEVKALNTNVLAIKRSHGDDSVVILLNIMDDVESLNLNRAFDGLNEDLEIVAVTPGSPQRTGDHAKSDTIWLMPKEAVVLQSIRSGVSRISAWGSGFLLCLLAFLLVLKN